jgi:hypothetical protein
MTDETTQEMSDLRGALTPIDRSQFMPAMSIEAAVERYNTITEFVSRVLRKDVDYGMIPGTDKLTLLKPGAEKLTTFFGLSTRFQLIERIEDWTGEEYNGEPFFYYLYRCQLYRDDLLIAEADASCNSRETKYRYREAQRVCPECNQAAIIKGREEFGGGWLCFRKKGGCGAKFLIGDQSIESQQVGRIPNPDIADQVNTIQKMAQKRALVGVCLLAVNASEFFTQDVEDMMIGPAPLVTTPQPAPVQRTETSAEDDGLQREILAACHALGKTEEQLADWIKKKYAQESLSSLTPFQQREVLRFLKNKLSNQAAA